MRQVESDSTWREGGKAATGSVRFWDFCKKGENFLVGSALVAMVLIPLAEIVLRAIFRVGISASTSLVQHLTLVVSMVGGGIAARENRLLSLSGAIDHLKDPYRSVTRIFSGAIALAVTVLLCAAGVQFILVERLGGEILAYGVPLWVVQLFIPAGFALISIHIIRYGATRWPGRLPGSGRTVRCVPRRCRAFA